MGNAWMDLVKKTSAEHKGKSLGEILDIAKKVYRKPNNAVHKFANKTRHIKKNAFRRTRAKRRQ